MPQVVLGHLNIISFDNVNNCYFQLLCLTIIIIQYNYSSCDIQFSSVYTHACLL